jgi:hypothetical protein
MHALTKILVAIVFAIGVAGCATQGQPFKDQETKVAKLKASEGRIYIYRNSSLGFMVQPSVFVNGAPVGTAVPNAVFFVDRSQGTYEVSASTEVEKKVTFTLVPGEEKYVRLTPAFGLVVGRIVPELVDKETGRTEMMDLSLITQAPK